MSAAADPADVSARTAAILAASFTARPYRRSGRRASIRDRADPLEIEHDPQRVIHLAQLCPRQVTDALSIPFDVDACTTTPQRSPA
jgi:hypothetical protein